MRHRLAPLVLLIGLAACALLPGGADENAGEGQGASPLATEAIAVTPLQGAVSADPSATAVPAEAATAPARPWTETAPVAPVAEPPAVVKSASQLACEKKAGRFVTVGDTGARTCVTPTRDGGKQCRKDGDCSGQCLARSNTCAPMTPLLGCNEILQSDGRRVTLCLD